jgi:hypothetical protein
MAEGRTCDPSAGGSICATAGELLRTLPTVIRADPARRVRRLRPLNWAGTFCAAKLRILGSSEPLRNIEILPLIQVRLLHNTRRANFNFVLDQ